MPEFNITAKQGITRGQMHIDKGQTFSININMQGIGPNNLFNNSRCHDMLKRQLEINGIYLSDSDIRGGRGLFDINIKKT